MSAHDMVIDNADGATVRADINAALAALVGNNAGTSAPGTTYAHMWWTDTATNKLKRRNAANSAWIEVLPDITATYGGLQRPVSITFHANSAASAAHSSFPAALTAIGGNTRSYTKIDLTRFTQARLIVNKQGTAANAGGKFVLRYYTATSFTASNYLVMGASSTEIAVAVDTTNAVLDSGWVDLVAGAIADVFINVFGIDGDGASNPAFGAIHAQFR